MNCPDCGAVTPETLGVCRGCGRPFQGWGGRRERAASAAAAAEPAAKTCGGSDAALTQRQAIRLPAAAFLAAAALANVGVGRFVVQSGLSMQLHELGHTLVYWLGGHFAVPIPMLTISFSEDRSWLWALAVAAGLVWLLLEAVFEECWVFAGVCAALIAAQFWLTLVVKPWTFNFLVAFGGLGGECVLSALLVVLYFHPLPARLKWQTLRPYLLLVGACVLAASLRRWIDASRDFMNVPWGSFWGGDGDVEEMLGAGWTVNRLVQVYLRLAWSCAGAAALAWAAAAWRALRAPRDSGTMAP
jgi:hypothetical protein